MQMSKSNPDFPRRHMMTEMSVEERALIQLMWDIEKLGGSPKLTKAITLLSDAKEALSDHIEGIE